jgi:2-dehydropantoate 2-reductase
VSRIAILGPGGVGAFVAAALARAGQDVLVVAREATAEVIAAAGIEVESVRLGHFAARPAVTAALTENVDVLLVATKATTLDRALERIRSEPRVTVPLLNGLEHMARLRERLDAHRVAAGVIRVESSSPAPGQVRQTSPFLRIDLASDDPRLRPALNRLASTLEAAEIPVALETSEAHVLWSKLVRLAALACTTSASGETIGFIRADPRWRQTLIGAIREAAAVANADGGQVDPDATVAELDAAHSELRSSMYRDILAGREPELDAIAGAVIRSGRRHRIECPTLERLTLCIAERTTPASAPFSS